VTSADGHSTEPHSVPSHQPTGTHAHASPDEAYTIDVASLAAGGWLVLVVESTTGSVVVGVAIVDDVVGGSVSGTVEAVVSSGDVVDTCDDGGGVTSGTEASESSSSDPHAAVSASNPMSRADRLTIPV
jgi:hypothetical protein